MEQKNHTDKNSPQETIQTFIEEETIHDNVFLFEGDRHEMDTNAAIWDENDTVQPVKTPCSHTRASGKPITIEHTAFKDLRGASITEFTAHAHIKGYNALIAGMGTLDSQTPGVMRKQFMAYVQTSHRGSTRLATLNKVRNGIYCLLLIHSHLNSQMLGTKKLLFKWKKRTIQKSAITLIQPFGHAFDFPIVKSGRKSPALAILCAAASYLRSIELRRLRSMDVILPGDVWLAHEQSRSAAFVVHSPKNDKGKPQIRVFKEIFFIALLKIFKDEHVRQLGAQDVNGAADILQQPICPDLSYHTYNYAIKSTGISFGLPNGHFTTNGAPVGAKTAQFEDGKDISTIKLSGGWKSQN